jgi:hypothetical protein
MDQRCYALIPVVRSQDYVLDMFYDGHYHARMTDSAPPRPASADEIVATLSFALQYEGRKRVHDAAGAMARITTERPVRHLQRPGFVIMKSAAAAAPTTTNMPPSVG